MSDELLDLIRAILGQPTAPYYEGAVRGEILQQLARLPHVSTALD
jgi:hypothetical protein